MKKIIFHIFLSALLLISCESKQKPKTIAEANIETQENPIQTTKDIIDNTDYTTESIVSGIQIPWGMTWLPDGSMLVTERSGTLYHIINGKKRKVKNVPEVYARNQGGLLDIRLHPNYKTNGWIYMTYSLVSDAERGSHTVLMRAKLQDNALVSIEKLYQGSPNVKTAHHFGSRIAFDNEGYVYFSIGDRGQRDKNPQDLTKDGGKIYRLHDDGRIPNDNPFVDTKNAKTAVYSYGHRNPQGMIKHPITGKIWTHEHGPRGGDELNIITKGVNYGWPVITYGINYSGTTITSETHREGMEQPLYYWVPSIAPSGMTFVTGNVYPDLKNHLLIGSLKFQYLELLRLKDDKVVKREKLLEAIGRVRSVRQGPDGYVYIGVDGKGILKVVPKTKKDIKVTPPATKEVVIETIEETTTEELKEYDTNKLLQQKELLASKKRGAKLYENFCVQCHMTNGKGVPKAFPPLAKSDWLLNNIQGSIKAIKYGQQGKITVNGQEYNSVMTPLGLSDNEVADVMNYILNSWGNSYDGIITEKDVAKVKK